MSIPQSGGGIIEHADQLAGYLEAGCKPKENWRIGTEHEKFGFLTESHKPLPYAGARSICAIFDELQKRFDWEPVFEGAHIVGMTRRGANISLEPGGQFELSGAAVKNVHETAAELRAHLSEVSAVTEGMGVRFASFGAAPEWLFEDMPVMPKGRYRLMTDYMGRVGTHGTQMMYRTATVQVNLDFASEADMVKKLRVAVALQPTATALFASSPFFEGEINGHVSWRSRIWRDLDQARTGMLPFVFEEGFGFQRYVDYALDVPMYFVYRDGVYHNALGQSFRDFLKGALPALPGVLPTLSDWADHLTTLFPEARLKRFIEMRGADAGDEAHLNALPAFWTGLMYDDGALDAAYDLIKGLDADTRQKLRVEASQSGLRGEAGGVKLADLAKESLNISAQGLAARGLGEGVFLQPLHQDVAEMSTQADRFLACYKGEWAGDLHRIYSAASL